MFQLKERLRKAGLADDPVDGIVETVCPEKPDSGNKTVRARFGRRRTHNEQLIVRPCGVIVSRATFFGSEPVSEVKVCLLFRTNLQSS